MTEDENGSKLTTVVLADDHAVVRSGLRMLLEAEDDIEVVAEAGDVAPRVRYVRGHQPTVLVLDVHMPDGSGGGGVPADRAWSRWPSYGPPHPTRRSSC